MKTNNHQEITRVAIGELFSDHALRIIINANIGQDALRYQIGHDHHHYDNCKFAETDKFVDSLRLDCIKATQAGNLVIAWTLFGKLTHTVQDFYAHSNYVELMSNQGEIPIRKPGAELPDGLISGKLYYPLEVITFVPHIPERIIQMFPSDSHARMNKDDLSRPHYAEARRLAIAATSLEVGKIIEPLTEKEKRQFYDR